MSGQIAHVNGKRDDNREENLAFLCLDHHDRYDSKTSQSKGLTERELKYYKKRLEEVEARRERYGEEKAVVQVEADFEAISKTTSEKILKSIAELALTDRPVVLTNLSGSDKFTVSIDSHDLASLMEADDKGLLKPMCVESIRPVIVESEREYEFYPEYPMLGTFSKKEHIRLFELTQYREGFEFRHIHWSAASYVNPYNDSLAAISIGIMKGTKTELTETLVISKEDVDAWQPSKPIDFLHSFLNRNGDELRLRNRTPQKLVLNTEIRQIWLPNLSTTAQVFNAVDVKDNIGSVGVYYSEKVGIASFQLLHMFSLPKTVVVKMQKTAKSERWF